MIEPAPGRSCGSCTSCCKIPVIEELQKPRGVYCSHCTVGVGCQVYADRPSVCRKFRCVWLCNPYMGPELKPETCHVLIWEWGDKRFVVAQCDPDQPDAWRAPIVINFLRQTLRDLAPGWKIVVMCGEKTWRITDRAILSDEGGVDWFVGCRATELWKFSLVPELS